MLPGLSDELSALAQDGLLRSLTVRHHTGGVWGADETGGRATANFSSNDYLNLARHPEVCEAAVDAVARWGTGATASRLMSGHLTLHEELEQEL